MANQYERHPTLQVAVSRVLAMILAKYPHVEEKDLSYTVSMFHPPGWDLEDQGYRVSVHHFGTVCAYPAGEQSPHALTYGDIIRFANGDEDGKYLLRITNLK